MVCPLSNVTFRVFPTLRHHNLGRMLERGLLVTINSDDAAHFGGYIDENYGQVSEALGLTRDQVTVLARNSVRASFLPEGEKTPLPPRDRAVFAWALSFYRTRIARMLPATA